MSCLAERLAVHLPVPGPDENPAIPLRSVAVVVAWPVVAQAEAVLGVLEGLPLQFQKGSRGRRTLFQQPPDSGPRVLAHCKHDDHMA